jgi:hypothetical protein
MRARLRRHTNMPKIGIKHVCPFRANTLHPCMVEPVEGSISDNEVKDGLSGCGGPGNKQCCMVHIHHVKCTA